MPQDFLSDKTRSMPREVTDRWIAARLISKTTAEAVHTATAPDVISTLLDLYGDNVPVAEITRSVDKKVAEAKGPLRTLAAEIFKATWEGIQADFKATFGRDMQ